MKKRLYVLLGVILVAVALLLSVISNPFE